MTGDDTRGGVTVLGNFSIDHIDDDQASPGGCPTFAHLALARLGGVGRIVTRAAASDLGLFDTLLGAAEIPIDVLPADCTSAFGLRYDGDERTMTVDAIGPVWTVTDLEAADIGTTWVLVSPLLRTDFPADTLGALSEAGHVIGYDGQGLVRAPRVGPMELDVAFDPAVLARIRVLKIADDEADALVGRRFDAAAAHDLAVPEILVTHGGHGCDLYVDGRQTFIPVATRVEGVHSTGAGDMFTVSYLAARAQGEDPVAAATGASAFVAEQLMARLAHHS